MELILQPTSETCGQACISMITGKDIEEVEDCELRLQICIKIKEGKGYGVFNEIIK